MLSLLIRPDVPFPSDGVRTLLASSINDNIMIRKVSILSVPLLLKNQKRPHKKKKIDPLKVDGNHESSKQIGDGRPDNRYRSVLHNNPNFL